MSYKPSTFRVSTYFELRFGEKHFFKHHSRGRVAIFIPTKTFKFERHELGRHSRYYAQYFQTVQGDDEVLDFYGDDDVEAYEMFHHFVHEGSLREESGAKVGWNNVDDLIEVYIFGERIGATQFMDAIMDELLRKIKPHNTPDKFQVKAVWRFSRQDSMLRKMFVEVCASGNAACCSIEDSDDYPNTFLRYFQKCYLRQQNDRKSTGIPRFGNLHTKVAELGSCWYHDHVSRGMDCYREVVHLPQVSAPTKRKHPLAQQTNAKSDEDRPQKRRRFLQDEDLVLEVMRQAYKILVPVHEDDNNGSGDGENGENDEGDDSENNDKNHCRPRARVRLRRTVSVPDDEYEIDDSTENNKDVPICTSQKELLPLGIVDPLHICEDVPCDCWEPERRGEVSRIVLGNVELGTKSRILKPFPMDLAQRPQNFHLARNISRANSLDSASDEVGVVDADAPKNREGYSESTLSITESHTGIGMRDSMRVAEEKRASRSGIY